MDGFQRGRLAGETSPAAVEAFRPLLPIRTNQLDRLCHCFPEYRRGESRRTYPLFGQTRLGPGLPILVDRRHLKVLVVSNILIVSSSADKAKGKNAGNPSVRRRCQQEPGGHSRDSSERVEVWPQLVEVRQEKYGPAGKNLLLFQLPKENASICARLRHVFVLNLLAARFGKRRRG
jgi:hypothetical protein